jgi:hypothetical protein
MIPESQPLAFDVDVCETESVLVQVTVVPASIARLSGENAPLPNTDAPMGMLIAVDAPPGVGTGVGAGVTGLDGDEESLPQAIASMETAAIRARRIENMMASALCNLRVGRIIPWA